MIKSYENLQIKWNSFFNNSSLYPLLKCNHKYYIISASQFHCADNLKAAFCGQSFTHFRLSHRKPWGTAIFAKFNVRTHFSPLTSLYRNAVPYSPNFMACIVNQIQIFVLLSCKTCTDNTCCKCISLSIASTTYLVRRGNLLVRCLFFSWSAQLNYRTASIYAPSDPI